MNIEQLYQLFLQYPSIQTDTRKLKEGDLFFALKGPNFNGNLFAARALELGAAYAIIDEDPAASGREQASSDEAGRMILVKDVLQTLQDLSLHHRQQFDIPFIAITGSNGKTTTKELVYTVLSSMFITYTTQGNLNNHIGIPLTILSVKKDAQFAVIEMGANHQGEIEGYCRYTLPTHGIITNAGKAHLEGFGGPEGVKKGKGELYGFLREHHGTAFVMWDYDYLQEMSRGIPHIISYGTRGADITGTVTQSEPFLQVSIASGASTGTISTQLVGDYNLPNVLVAVAVGKHFGVPDSSIRTAIENYTPSNSRSQLIRRDGNSIILDAYNANPSSMKAAIENFARINATGNGKILILGAMAELGPESLEEHRQIVDLIGQYPWQQVILVGGDFQRIDHPYLRFENSLEAGGWLNGFLQQPRETGIYMLIKGSRSMKMEQVLD
ncbi:UDP-N-acetylmuramoyl-tripeptide--D-alanyl-D-alanine ligase [Flavitalea flava]